jgi:hypothetical protein
MSTCLSKFTHSFLTICNTIKFKVDKKISLVSKGGSRIVEAKQTIFLSRYGSKEYIFLSLSEVGNVYKISYLHEVWNIEKKVFHEGGC